MMRAAGFLLVASLAGCAAPSPVRLTHSPTDIEHCKQIGAVQTLGPYAMPGDDVKQIRERTIAVGADTVLVSDTRRANLRGIAYRCGNT